VEVTTPSNQMDLDQDIQVINPKDKNVSPEEKDKWRMPELPPVPKGYLSTRTGLWQPNSKSGNFSQVLDRHHELISSSEEAHGARKDRGTFEGLDTHVLQRTSPTDKIVVEKLENVIRGPEGEIGPRKGKQPSGSSPSLHKCQTSPRKPQRPTRRARKRQRERQSPSGTSLTCRTTGFQRKRRQPWTMCSIWQEL
ncbi:hypothetical protein O181_103254, partial [Austropuccinia psidii MF-1]|nr:hypothetical protein [Austropuccinia psidii MF-1]